nr:carboxylesterase family protein [Vibrio sp. F13]
MDATQFGVVCPQLKITQQEQSEDCLNLNIWRPSEINGSESLPVYVFIHGGDFEYGAGSDTDINGDTVVDKRYHSIYGWRWRWKGEPRYFQRVQYRCVVQQNDSIRHKKLGSRCASAAPVSSGKHTIDAGCETDYWPELGRV